MQIDLDQLQALTAAVAEGSFDAAARRLHVTPSAISQRIKALETNVGRVLLIRSRPVRPTASGQTLLRAARQIDAVTAEVAHELGEQGEDQLPTIALAVNADSLGTWFLPALSAVDPPLAFDLRRADETRTAELLRDGSVIAAVAASADPVPGCVARPLGRMRYQPRASPAYVARWFPEGVTARSAVPRTRDCVRPHRPAAEPLPTATLAPAPGPASPLRPRFLVVHRGGATRPRLGAGVRPTGR